ncbi:MSMEG_0569 family flavin-dependent oxidoreductase [Amycolatopsis acidiphila]|uniref:MSMEG_0569 family flavin-dependent oxidoreductase n=1 Tax=Amycolatopsis acidiphila TaxID=715473 RepID=A0A558ANZ3_9PSEU|nr:MSMEG_0569 family flavin-dependent oxidoreductase [Amycolatopsis acidiphila]TVT25974.1 MSMEG_0569 family flavin-dependent oxidoreductase [Amycolatopsis acidiphila]UIJ63313.1 MSMEG_0569 family flavin-dependent oxidoreductase [Amycolatopsis acidiphila]GHG74966.1 FAD-dependent oxidoreductase [Amycolatopsis acidiphila]
MSHPLDGRHHSVLVIGGGQAGLSMSYCLRARGIDHLVLERDEVGHEWRDRRWDMFCLVTPNWQCQLPGFPYRGGDPEGFMGRAEIVSYVQEYARTFGLPVVEGVGATRLRVTPHGFLVRTSQGDLTADQVVVATGPYQVPLIPRMTERLPESLVQLHSSQYRNPGQLPAGEVLVVGTGQSGCQIAEDLHLAGRRVHLSVGSAPRVARRYRGRDVVAWLDEMGYYRRGIDEFADADAVRFRANHYVTGRDGGHDIDLRAFALEGMRLYGRLSGIDSGFLRFRPDLRKNLDAADAVSEGIKSSIDAYIAEQRIGAPAEERYTPVWEPDADPAELSLSDSGITSVVWSTGFGRDHRWIDVPIFDGRGYPTHDRGVTSCEGLYFLGLPWQYTWGSGRFCGVAADAEFLASRIELLYRGGKSHEVRWLAGVPRGSYENDDWVAPRTVA